MSADLFKIHIYFKIIIVKSKQVFERNDHIIAFEN